jgi:hypothetical protein
VPVGAAGVETGFGVIGVAGTGVGEIGVGEIGVGEIGVGEMIGVGIETDVPNHYRNVERKIYCRCWLRPMTLRRE